MVDETTPPSPDEPLYRISPSSRPTPSNGQSSNPSKDSLKEPDGDGKSECDPSFLIPPGLFNQAGILLDPVFLERMGRGSQILKFVGSRTVIKMACAIAMGRRLSIAHLDLVMGGLPHSYVGLLQKLALFNLIKIEMDDRWQTAIVTAMPYLLEILTLVGIFSEPTSFAGTLGTPQTSTRDEAP